jgi:hypothetical protein
MKTIQTLIADIYKKVGSDDGWFDEALAREFSQELGTRLVETIAPRNQVPTLRLSKMGPSCERALWYSIHSPELAEQLPPSAKIKYIYGHILETFVIAMAKAAGHEVTGEQDAVTVDGITGHRDCVIDGCIVDVKSCSSLAFKKFEDKTIVEEGNDSFGYLDQLDGYLCGSSHDPLVRVKDRAYILAIDKTLGHLCLYEHKLREQSIRDRIKLYKEITARPLPPRCTCETVAEGKSGNIKLGTRASYSGFKHSCFPALRTFLYAKGPVFLTHVERIPDVPEITKEGGFVQH